MNQPSSANDELARVFRAEAGRVLALLISRLRDFDLAEEALQEAISQAAKTWPHKGVPQNGAAWLFSVARRKAVDRLRHRSVQSTKAVQLTLLQLAQEVDAVPEYEQEIPDERLRLIFTCCHPALAKEAQVALTLKTLCGLGVREIARAFLVSETTMAQRLIRAKAKIKTTRIAYQVPERGDLPGRTDAVLAVIYLIYNESYTALSGDALTRPDLANEALRLSRTLYTLLPSPETAGLMALLMLHGARHEARVSETGAMIPLEDQDRTAWDAEKIEQGRGILHRALAARKPGPYQIQAAISALHSEAPDWASTDWRQIAGLYRALLAMSPSPVIALNHAVALSYCGQTDEALVLIDGLEPDLPDYQPLHAARADFYARLGDRPRAREDFDRAIALSTNPVEADFLRAKSARLLN